MVFDGAVEINYMEKKTCWTLERLNTCA